MKTDKQTIRVSLLVVLITASMLVLGTNNPAVAQTSPSVDVETKFVVYPDGQVALEGAVKATGINYPGPAASGSFNLTGSGGITQASAQLTANFPPQMASVFPFNTTNGEIDITYSDSNGILAVGINGDTILPPIPSPPPPNPPYPFDIADAQVVGSYSANKLVGSITFSVFDAYTFDDLNVDFIGTKTDFTLEGNVTIAFGVPFGNLRIDNETQLSDMIIQLKSTLPGQINTMTGGSLTVTSFNIDYYLVNSDQGAFIWFDMHVQGDFVKTLAYLMTQGKNIDFLYPAIEQLYSSSQSGSFQIDYKHDTRKVTVKLAFNFNLKSFMDYILNVPSGTKAYALSSQSYQMSPALLSGDIVFVEPVADPSTIVAVPDSGDIIAFYHPSVRDVVIHRAISKTLWNGVWYFQTKGDSKYSPDSWSGPDTYNGMVSSKLLIGKAFRRVPLLGFVLSPLTPYYTDYVKGTFIPLEPWKASFSSLQELSVWLSYSSAKKQLDLKASATVKGDLNTEFNYIKDFFMFTSFSGYSMTIPWQIKFLNETKIVDTSNLKIRAKIDSNTLEGSLQGLTVKPPIDPIDPTQFKLERFFNLTAPMSQGQQESTLREITVEGGSNATHTVTIYRPETVPQPSSTGPDNKYMIWNNQKLSSLKGLVFKIGAQDTGTLKVQTTPVAGGVFVNGTSWGTAPQERLVAVGTYNVSFGSVAGYHTPEWQLATVTKDQTTTKTGEYVEIGTISLNVDQSSATVGSTIAISGVITPKRANVDVTIYYRVEGGSWKTLATVKTDAEGRYSYTWEVSEAGALEFKASWKDEHDTLIESSLKTVNVSQPPPSEPSTLTLPTELWIIIIVVLVAIVIAIAGIYLRKRK